MSSLCGDCKQREKLKKNSHFEVNKRGTNKHKIKIHKAEKSEFPGSFSSLRFSAGE